ncbi:MAG: hypothetical protein J6R86_09365 [Lentisphaeria bacterium]|nr:hypothetical protein [Lentisphaeria bacterium]
MKFDFAKFPAKVAELNRLREQVRNLGDLRRKSGKEEDIVRWKKAVGDWKEFSGFGYPEDKFYLFENEDFLAELSAGEREAKKMAVKFLEFDPYYYRSGYIKSKLLVRLKNIKLSDTEAERLRQVVCNAIVSRQPKSEFKYYARLLKNIGTPEFFRRLQNLAVPEIPYIKSRLECCLQPVYWQ